MNYEDVINSSKLVLVEFFATWCPHCQRMMPVVEAVREKLGNKAKVVQIDIDKNPELTEEQGVEGTPTFILYKDGQEVWRQSGEMPGEELYETVKSFE